MIRRCAAAAATLSAMQHVEHVIRHAIYSPKLPPCPTGAILSRQISEHHALLCIHIRFGTCRSIGVFRTLQKLLAVQHLRQPAGTMDLRGTLRPL